MTPPSANLNLVTALQAQPSGKKQSDTAAADSPFSQALSKEIAQNKSGSETRNDPKQDVQARSDSADSTPSRDPVSTEASTADSLNPSPAENGALQPGATLPVTDATAVLPVAMLAMAAAPNLLVPPPLPASDGAVATDALATRAPILLNPQTGTPAPALQPAQAQPANTTTDALASAAQQTAKGDFQAAMTTATSIQTSAAAAASLPGQIAAALSPDSLKIDETRSDGINSPLMAVAPHALLNTISTPASSALAPSVGSAAWGQALGEKIVWMAAGAQQTASLTLNPPNLGPLQIVVNVTNDQATASFFSAQPEVRQALEAALPKLREMMNEAGIQLGQATVSSDAQQQQNEATNRETRRIASSYPGANNEADSGTAILPTLVRQSGRGLVDTFA